MGIDVLTILSGIISILTGAIAIFARQKLSRQEEKRNNPISYRERITKTLDTLKKASEEMEIATVEFNSIMKEKQSTIDDLEGKLSVLSSKETELTSRIETLQNVPIEVLKHFEEILNRGNKRSAYRDYLLFGAGVVVSIIVAIILKQF